MTAYLSLILRDLSLSVSKGPEAMKSVFFFILVASLFPFALGSETAALRAAAPGIIWVAALLSALLSLESFYHRDFDDGTFDLMMLSPASGIGIMMSKMFTHWLVSGLALVVAAVPLSQMLFMSWDSACVLLLSLVLGTVYMSLLGGAGAVLTMGTRRPGVLLALLVLPLFVPMLILGILAVEAALAGLPYTSYLLLQSALVLVALPFLPWASAALLHMHLKS